MIRKGDFVGQFFLDPRLLVRQFLEVSFFVALLLLRFAPAKSHVVYGK